MIDFGQHFGKTAEYNVINFFSIKEILATLEEVGVQVKLALEMTI